MQIYNNKAVYPPPHKTLYTFNYFAVCLKPIPTSLLLMIRLSMTKTMGLNMTDNT